MSMLRRPTAWATLAMCVAAAASTVCWWLTDVADEWMPNLATTFVGTAATITVVDWIVRREARERLRPRRDRVLYWLGLDVRIFMDSLVLDYAESHAHGYRPIPGDVLEMIDQWRSDHDLEDTPRRMMDENGRRAPLIVLAAVELAQRLERTRERDLDLLPPDLVRTMDDFVWAAGQAAQLVGFSRASGSSATQHGRISAALIVDHFERFVRTFFQDGSRGWREITDLSRRGNDEHHRNLAAATRAPTDAVQETV